MSHPNRPKNKIFFPIWEKRFNSWQVDETTSFSLCFENTLPHFITLSISSDNIIDRYQAKVFSAHLFSFPGRWFGEQNSDCSQKYDNKCLNLIDGSLVFEMIKRIGASLVLITCVSQQSSTFRIRNVNCRSPSFRLGLAWPSCHLQRPDCPRKMLALISSPYSLWEQSKQLWRGFNLH